MADPKQPTQKEVDDLTAKLKEADEKLREAQEALKAQPKSDNSRTAAEIIARKLSTIAPYLTPLGLLRLSPEELDKLKEELTDNFKRLIELLEKIADILVTIVEGVYEVFKSIVKKIISVIERHTGKGSAEKTAMRISMKGSTDNLRLHFSDVLQGYGMPADFGPLEGSWVAEGEYYGTDASGNEKYRLTSYSSETPALLIGPAQLEGLHQVINAERDSVFTIDKNGNFNGTLYTRFLCDSWGDDPLGIPASSRINGKIKNNKMSYSAEGEEILWASYLVPGLQTITPPMGK